MFPSPPPLDSDDEVYGSSEDAALEASQHMKAAPRNDEDFVAESLDVQFNDTSVDLARPSLEMASPARQNSMQNVRQSLEHQLPRRTNSVYTMQDEFQKVTRVVRKKERKRERKRK